MKRRKMAGRTPCDDGLEQTRGDPSHDSSRDGTWETYALHVDQEAQRFYEALARSICIAEEGLRDERVPAMGRAYLARIVSEAKKALGKGYGVALGDSIEISMDLTSRSLN